MLLNKDSSVSSLELRIIIYFHYLKKILHLFVPTFYLGNFFFFFYVKAVVFERNPTSPPDEKLKNTGIKQFMLYCYGITDVK